MLETSLDKKKEDIPKIIFKCEQILENKTVAMHIPTEKDKLFFYTKMTYDGSWPVWPSR